MIVTPAPSWLPNPPTLHPYSPEVIGGRNAGNAPSSAAWGNNGRATLFPLTLHEPYPVTRAWWCNGATVGTDSVDLGIYRMTDFSTGRVDLLRSMGATLTAGSINTAQEVTAFKVAMTNLTSGGSTVDGDTFTTASVTLKAGKTYLLMVGNSHASAAPAVSSITGGGTWAIAHASATLPWNSNAMRLSVWALTPTADYTGTLAIAFGASSGVTGCTWSLQELVGADEAALIVQVATGTGNSTTPSATLGAFGSAQNATIGVIGAAAGAAVTPGTGFTELSDSTIATPTMTMEVEWRQDNDTGVDGTVTSGQWGIIALEVKASTAALVIPPTAPLGGISDLYLAQVVSGGTTRIFGGSIGQERTATSGIIAIAATAIPLPTFAIPLSPIGNNVSSMVGGFSLASVLA